MNYKSLKIGIFNHLNDAAEDFFLVGYYLRQISNNALFVEDGYKNIWEFAKAEYGLSTSSASRFMAINARFSLDGGEHMAEKYIGMGVSKLQEMLGLPDEELEKVTKETTVRELRAMKAAKKEPLSFFGFPVTKRPEGSLITTVGCGDGKHDCFTCCRDCEIRQEERYCRTAMMGNPFPCSRMSDDFKKGMQHSLYKDQCQHLHPELAPVRAGDKEPDPCCLTCDIEYCFSRCDVAKKRDKEKRKAAEAARPEPSGTDIKAFYEWHSFKLTDNITADGLKKQFRNAGGGGGAGLNDFWGSSRGVRINFKRELTYAQLAKRLKEIQEKERKAMEAETAAKSAPNELPEDRAPVIIDADFREVEEQPELEAGDPEEPDDEPKDDPAQEAQENTNITEPDPEHYEPFDVWNLLMDHQDDLQAYREAGMPDNLMQKQRILTDALELLYGSIKEAGEDD